jgi:hypothetical protein
MADEPKGSELTEADIDSFVEKLEAWGNGLTEAEQGMLHLLLARAEAGAADSEVEGFGFGTIAAPGAGFGGPSIPSPAIRADNVLRPIVSSTPLFFGLGKAGTIDTWSRG